MRAEFDGFKICVVGNCQVSGVGVAARAMLPGSTVEPIHLHPRFNPDDISSRWSDFDLILTHHSDPVSKLPGIGNFEGAQAKTVFVPPVFFTGFHPDANLHRPSISIMADFGGLHSAIVAAAFNLGLPSSRVPRLFNAYVYRQLGYDIAFDSSREAFIDLYRGYGFDLSPWLSVWMADGPFMYISNHPSIRVLATITKLVLDRAGFTDGDAPIPADLPDFLGRSVVWPVYPELARETGHEGSLTFLRSVASVAAGERREVDLPAFVERSYHLYRTLPAAAERVDRIGHATDVLDSILVSAAA